VSSPTGGAVSRGRARARLGGLDVLGGLVRLRRGRLGVFCVVSSSRVDELEGLDDVAEPLLVLRPRVWRGLRRERDEPGGFRAARPHAQRKDGEDMRGGLLLLDHQDLPVLLALLLHHALSRHLRCTPRRQRSRPRAPDSVRPRARGGRGAADRFAVDVERLLEFLQCRDLRRGPANQGRVGRPRGRSKRDRYV
jgi:hypothetical protein